MPVLVELELELVLRSRHGPLLRSFCSHLPLTWKLDLLNFSLRHCKRTTKHKLGLFQALLWPPLTQKQGKLFFSFFFWQWSGSGLMVKAELNVPQWIDGTNQRVESVIKVFSGQVERQGCYYLTLRGWSQEFDMWHFKSMYKIARLREQVSYDLESRVDVWGCGWKFEPWVHQQYLKWWCTATTERTIRRQKETWELSLGILEQLEVGICGRPDSSWEPPPWPSKLKNYISQNPFRPMFPSSSLLMKSREI